MKIEYNNLYTHFVLTTFDRIACIKEENSSTPRCKRGVGGVTNSKQLTPCCKRGLVEI